MYSKTRLPLHLLAVLVLSAVGTTILATVALAQSDAGENQGETGQQQFCPTPSAPTELSAEGRDRSISVTWKAVTVPAGGFYLDYVVSARPSTGPGGGYKRTSATSAIFTGLANDETYTVSVRAVVSDDIGTECSSTTVSAIVSTTAAPSALPTPRPTPVPNYTPVPRRKRSPPPEGVIYHTDDPCGPAWYRFFHDDEVYMSFVHWTADGSHLVFDSGDTIQSLHVKDRQLWQIAEVDTNESKFVYGFYADISPDGSRIVYSTCEYTDHPYWWVDEDWSHLPSFHSAGYEIASVDVDGSSPMRVTDNTLFESFPVWSPDGTRIAFVSSTRRYKSDFVAHYYPDRSQLAIMSPEGSEITLVANTRGAWLYPPTWSPDGQRLTFIFNKGSDQEPVLILYTVFLDGYGLTEIGETTAPPTWSPHGGEMAFAAMDGDQAVINVVGPDGTGLRQVWSAEPDDDRRPITQLSWSPDGSELLFIISGRLHVVGSDDGGHTFQFRSSTWPRLRAWRASWSPDGSRIALYRAGLDLSTVSRDGTEHRLLVDWKHDGRLYVVPPEHVTACSAGVVVPEPEANPGLVQDCVALFEVRDALAGSAQLDWDFDTPITQWEGVSVRGVPPRVLGLGGRGLSDLNGNIPPELGNLTALKGLDLANNELSGSIPPELGRLTNLEYLSLESNQLEGAIPPEIGDMRSLRTLSLADNNLRGDLPPEMGRLGNLTNLDLGDNLLTGSIPVEWGGMARLQNLRLLSNDLSGCIPVELPDMWVEQSGLDRCETNDQPKVAEP